MSINKYTNKMAQKADAFKAPETKTEEISVQDELTESSAESPFSEFILAEGGKKKERGKNSHTFYIDDAHYRKIKDLAYRSGLSTSEVINMILNKCL